MYSEVITFSRNYFYFQYSRKNILNVNIIMYNDASVISQFSFFHAAHVLPAIRNYIVNT